MTRCIAILALALTSTLFADQSSAEESGSVIVQQWRPSATGLVDDSQVVGDITIYAIVPSDLSGLFEGTWEVPHETISLNHTVPDYQAADYILLLDMGFSPEEADYILLSDFILEIEVPFALIPLQIPDLLKM